MKNQFCCPRKFLLSLLILSTMTFACTFLDWSAALTSPETAPSSPNFSLLEKDQSTPTTPNFEIKGTIKDALNNKPLSAIVHLTGDADKIIADSYGQFTGSLAEPTTNLRIELPGYETQEVTWTSSEDALIIDLIPLKLNGALRTVDAAEPLAGVTIQPISQTHPQTTTTRPDGTFDLYRLTTDDVITVQPPEGYLPVETKVASQDALTLTLKPRRLTISAQDLFYGRPAAGVPVTFESTLSEIVTATTNISGQVAFSHIPPAGQIVISHTGYLPLNVDYADQATLELSLAPASLQGVVRRRETGEIIPQAKIYLGETVWRADDEGRFSLDNLPTEPQRLMVKAAGYHRAYAQLAPTGLFTNTMPPPFSGVEGRWLTWTPCEITQASAGPCVDVWLEPFQAKAIYIPFHYLGGRDLMLSYLDFVAETELNAIVVDVKGDFGFIGWQSNVESVMEIGADAWRQPYWMPLDELVAEAKKRNVYTIARMVVFKDDPLARNKPDLATVREDGSAWIDGEDLGWANPFKEEVWDYNIALAKEVAGFGFDEINFDYIRFPSDGDVGAIVYEEENTLETRTAAIGEFMRRLTTELEPYGIFTSADVFGLTVWVEPESDMRIGQRVIDIAPHIDYLAPMIYPSTFIPGNLGYDNPSAEPYGVIFNSQNEAETRVPPYVKVRPWLQAYWYSVEEMQLQKQGAEDAQSTGWAWWNAGGKYDDDLFGVDEESAQK